MQSNANKAAVEHTITGDITLSSAEMLNKYLKPHHSSSAHKPILDDTLMVHTSAEKSTAIKKKHGDHSARLFHIPTFTEK